MIRRTFILAHEPARQGAIQAVREAPDGYVVEIKERTRSLDQNAKFHAMLMDISQQCKWMGKALIPEQWKVLFVSGHAIATGEGAEMVPGLEGEFCNIRESTAKMSKSRMCSLIEYVQAWGSNQGIRWSA